MNHTKTYQAFGLGSGKIYAEGDYVSVRRLLNSFEKVWIKKGVHAEFTEPILIIQQKKGE